MCDARRVIRWTCICGRDLYLVAEAGEAVLYDRFERFRTLEPITHCVVCQRPVPAPSDPELLALAAEAGSRKG
jgi:hypothetical protein